MTKFKFLFKNNEEGFALIFTFIAITTILTLGVILLNTTLAEFKQTERDINKTKAYYKARTGAQLLSEAVKKGEIDPTKSIYLDNSFTIEDPNSNTIVKDIKMTKSSNTYTITSTASAGPNNNVTEKVVLSFKDFSYPQFEHTIYTEAPLHIGKDNQITIDVTDSNGIASSDDITIDKSQDESALNPKRFTNYTFPEVSYPDNLAQENDWDGSIINETNYTQDHYFNQITANNRQLEINTHDKEVNIYVYNLSLKNTLTINGNGLVNFFITGDSELQTPNATHNSSQVFYFLKKGVTFDLLSNSQNKGYIYGPGAKVLMNSSDTTFTGALISNVLNKNNSQEEFKGEIIYEKPNQIVTDNIEKHAKPFQIIDWSRQ